MIKLLNIRNLAVIDEIELEFDKGLTVLTGETGAGKSILIEALGLILGDRAETAIIRDGCDRTDITAVFEINNNRTVLDLLEEQSISVDDSELLIRRVISRDGRSRAFVNNSPVTAQLLRTIGEYLIDIHGQHAHHSLTKPDNQRQLLDDYGDYPAQLEQVYSHYSQWQEATVKLRDLSTGDHDSEAAMALLRYQVEELREINPGRDEYETLDEEHRRMANVNRLLETAGNALRLFYEEDDAIQARLNTISNEFKSLTRYDGSLANLVRILDEASIQIDEACTELRDYIDKLQFDPERLAEVEDRLSKIYAIARKYRIQPQDLATFLADQEQKLETMANSRKIIENLTRLQAQALTLYKTASDELHLRREAAAKKMSSEITVKLAELGMSGGKFSITVEQTGDDQPKPYGSDRIEYQVTTNPGIGLQPLRKIASGGELSRISLAIQVTGNKNSSLTAMVFDEVDAGIGGGIAEIVGKLLHKLAGQHQVFCVTHLPQVAAQGDHHILVNKTSTKKSTTTSVKALTNDERIEEIARMLGGVRITDRSRQHALEMLSHNREKTDRIST